MSDALNVTTDQADYQPGETAVFTASNVELGGTVEFSVAHVSPGADGIYGTEDDQYTYDLTGTGITWSVTDGGEGDADGIANGVVTTSWYVNWDAANETFLLSATDTASGETATASFTDAPPVPVPAVVVDVDNGLVVLTGNDPHGTGTGVFPAFVQIQGDGEAGGTNYDDDDDSSTEEGFNTSWREAGSPDSPVLDTDNGLPNNHDLLLSAVPLVEIDDVLYREFRLDLGEGGADEITLDSLILYWSPTGSQSTLAGLNEIYNMDGGTDGKTGGAADVDGHILLEGWQSGQGGSDYKFYIPESYFVASGVSFDDYVYLYSAFSNADSEFEEWSVASTSLTAPDINIVKVTIDADETGDGITSIEGETITWRYTITNTGNVALSNVVLSDDHLNVLYDSGVLSPGVTFVSGDVNNNDILETTETWVFEISGTAINGSYSNIGTVSGDYLGQTATDSDPSSYTGHDSGQDFAAIAIEKVTLDGETDAAGVAAAFLLGGDSDTILVDEKVTWIYKVTNAGTLDLENVVVTDDQGVTVTYLSGDTGSDGILGLNETWYFTATGSAAAGDYENIGTASGNPTGGDEVTANDESGYFGADPSLTIEKSIVCDDGETVHDADTAIILLEDADGLVDYRIVVTNTGNVDLTDVVVSDSLLTLGAPEESGDNDGILSVGETWTYTVSGDWKEGENTNTATATVTYEDTAGHAWQAEDGAVVSDSAIYFGAAPEITVDKLTNGLDNGGNVFQGQPIEWTYAVSNTGNVDLTDITITDNAGTLLNLSDDFTPTYVDGDDGDGILNVGETWNYSYSGTAILGTYTNTVEVSANTWWGDEALTQDACGESLAVSDDDTSGYTGLAPAETFTQGYWSNHTDAWDGCVGNEGKSTKIAEVNPRKDGVLLGDLNHNGIADDGCNFFIAMDVAKYIEAGSTTGDARLIMLAQAIAAQLNIYHDQVIYGDPLLVTEPINVIQDAVKWLKTYGGQDDNNILSGEVTYSKNNGITLKEGSKVLTSSNAWNLLVDQTADSGVQHNGHDIYASGEGLKNALMWWNQGELKTSTDGSLVGWYNDPSTNQTNTLDHFWLTLHLVGGLPGIG